MPLIKARANRVAIVRHISRLSQPNRDALVLYARFIGDTPDYVLNRLLETTIAKDHDFLAWRAEHPAQAVAASPDRAATSTEEALQRAQATAPARDEAGRRS
jgi:hypothetical protein